MSRSKNNLNKKSKKIKRNNDSYDVNNYNNKTSKLCAFSYVDYIILASTVAIALGEELSQEDIAILASFFAVLSDELALIASMMNCDGGDKEPSIFVAPVPDVALTSNHSRKSKKNKTLIKKKK